MGESITFREGDVSGSGYLALPPSGSGAAVIVIQEWWGLVDHIKAVVDRFAAAGFVALAPDLYHGQAAAEPDTARKLMMEMEMQEASRDISAAAHFLLSRPETISTSVGAVGFCMGGSLAIWSSTIVDSINASVGFYPGGSWERMAPKWESYAGKFAMIHCAESDGTSSAPGIQEAVAAITAAHGSVETFDYPGTKHAFFNDDRPEVYDREAAEITWERTVEFFREHVK